MGAFFNTGIGQFVKGALLAGLASVIPFLNTANFSLKLLLTAFAGGVLEYLHNLIPNNKTA